MEKALHKATKPSYIFNALPPQIPSHKNKTALTISFIVQNLISSLSGYAISWPYRKHVLLVILLNSALYFPATATCSYSCWKYLEQSNVHGLPFFSSAHRHKCTETHTHTLACAHSHTGTTFMPCDLARHYASSQTCHLPEISLRRRERERERGIGRGRERGREKFCTFASLWELLVKCKYSTYTGNMKFSCCSYPQCSAVRGQTIKVFLFKINKYKKGDMWCTRPNVELFWGSMSCLLFIV